MGGSAPEDHSAEVARIEQQAAQENQARMDREAAKKQTDFDKRINSAFGTGISGAERFFTSQGLDPKKYGGQIRQGAADIRGGVPNLDANPGSYFANLGQQIYDAEQGAERNRDLRGIDTYAPAGFATSRIADTADDASINALLGEQQQTGEDYITNLLNRGVVTAGGADAARKNLAGQRPTALSRLSALGQGELEAGRGGAENLVNAGRTKASNQRLGDNFDPFALSGDLTKYFGDFFKNLDTNIRGKAPTDLFSTSGLANIAGAAQGAGNNAFNPNAVAGIFDQNNTDEEDQLPAVPF